MLLPFDIAHMQDQKFIILGYIVRDIMKIYVRGINTHPRNGISLVKYSLQFKATLSRWQNLKKSGWLFQVRILSSWFYHNDKTFFQLHCTGIVTFYIQWKPLRNSRFFAYVISRKRSANQRKKNQNSVYRVKLSPHAKIQLLLNTFKNGQKIKGLFLLWAFQLILKMPIIQYQYILISKST